MLDYNIKLKERSRELRNNMTDVEIILWSKLKRKQINKTQFYRQKPIGDYIVDFYCPKYKLVIELDGSQHYSNSGQEYDLHRDNYLKGIGMKVLRFTNYDVKKRLTAVLEIIENEMH
ncbi:MAG: endonuclease domain-containing protein [Desulfobulbaceae bacterium]|nr:endonuclease domain-containing protein [Desulfobulbaceae bacterium]